MKPQQVAVAAILLLAISELARAADRPSGMEVWQTCREDARVVCPHAGLVNIAALKTCMRDNFTRLGSRCQQVIVRYQAGRPLLASGSDSPRLR